MKRIKPVLVARTRNAKTGDVPTVWVGTTLAESRESCVGCGIRNKCYAQNGSPRIAISSIARVIHGDPAKNRAPRGVTQHGANALSRRHKGARMVRISALGDPARADRRSLTAILRATRRSKLAIVGYTHFREEAPDLRGILMASCDDVEMLRGAVSAGWRAAVVMPRGTVGTLRDGDVKIIECPAIAAGRKGKSYTCNDCATRADGALCDASKYSVNVAVYFADHSRPRKSLPVLA